MSEQKWTKQNRICLVEPGEQVRKPVGTTYNIPIRRELVDLSASSVTGRGEGQIVVVVLAYNLHDKQLFHGAAPWPPSHNTQLYYSSSD